MRFSLDAAIYRRLPFETSFRPPAALATRDISREASPTAALVETHKAWRPPAPRWFEMVQGNVSLNNLFR